MGKNMNPQTLHLWYIIHKGLHLLNICTIYQPVVNNSFNYCIILQSIVDCVSFLDTQQQSYAMAKNLMRRLYNQDPYGENYYKPLLFDPIHLYILEYSFEKNI